MSLRRFSASVYHHNFPSLVASFFSWRSLAAFTTFRDGLNTYLCLLGRRFPIPRNVKRPDVVLYAVFGPLFLLPTPSSTQHDSLRQPPAAHSDKRPRPQKSCRAQAVHDSTYITLIFTVNSVVSKNGNKCFLTTYVWAIHSSRLERPCDVSGPLAYLVRTCSCFLFISRVFCVSNDLSLVLKTTLAELGVCLCVFVKLHIIAQSSPVILVILCHSHWSSQGRIHDTITNTSGQTRQRGHTLCFYSSYLSPEYLVLLPLLPCYSSLDYQG